MKTTMIPAAESLKLSALFDEKSPVLVEVRFPKMGTAPDWYLCREEEELEPILENLGTGAEVRLHSVWDLADSTGGVVIGKL